MTPETSVRLMLKLYLLLRCFGAGADRPTLTFLSLFLCNGISPCNLRWSLNSLCFLMNMFPPHPAFFSPSLLSEIRERSHVVFVCPLHRIISL